MTVQGEQGKLVHEVLCSREGEDVVNRLKPDSLGYAVVEVMMMMLFVLFCLPPKTPYISASSSARKNATPNFEGFLPVMESAWLCHADVAASRRGTLFRR